MVPSDVRVGAAEDQQRLSVSSKRKRPWRMIVILLAAVIVVGLGTIWLLHRYGPHPGGDPDGAILGSIRTQVDEAVPAGVKITKVHSSDAKWVSAGCDGTSGWTSPTYDVTFTSSDSPSKVVGTVNDALTADGWKSFHAQSGPGLYRVWIRSATDTATMALYGDHPPQLPAGTWQIGGDEPPQGQVYGGC